MARRKGRVKDKWREKRWVTVSAPESFNNVPIAYVPITDDENAIGRVLDVTLYD
ncbi:MAG: 30S ribosomal protein S3ae, partial [Nitrosopumilus sp.]|nr:30S ribosomal protein S3ae [Nitrosopumilus sp.]NNL53421.1 30S ribosomal protein S3ae [Nitrosopumilus sp.]